MIEIKSDTLRNKLLKFYEFDTVYSEFIEGSDGQFTGNFWHETFNVDGVVRTYYFDGNKLVAYEGHFELEEEK